MADLKLLYHELIRVAGAAGRELWSVIPASAVETSPPKRPGRYFATGSSTLSIHINVVGRRGEMPLDSASERGSVPFDGGKPDVGPPGLDPGYGRLRSTHGCGHLSLCEAEPGSLLSKLSQHLPASLGSFDHARKRGIPSSAFGNKLVQEIAILRHSSLSSIAHKLSHI